MLILWSILLATAAAHKVVDSNEDIGPEAFYNITTLYPVPNNTTVNINRTETKTENPTENHVQNDIIPKEQETSNKNSSEEKNETKNDTIISKSQATIWKIEANFGETGSEERRNVSTNVTNEFKPSQHLGDIIEDVYPTRSSYESYTINKPATEVIGPTKDYRSQYEIPKHFYENYKEYPHSYDYSSKHKDSWRQEKPGYWRPGLDIYETKPTVEVPVRIPAGGIYKYQEPFREKPHTDEYGVGLHEGIKDGEVIKRGNPWEDFLRLLTAFIPVGIIISALTPSIITVENTDNGYSSNVFRRSDPSVSTLPVISERCRRRLLCELHSDNNYIPYGHTLPKRPRKHCYKIRCEDPEAIATTLKWLLEYRRTQNYK